MAQALADRKCIACGPDSPVVSDRELPDLQREIPEWAIVEIEGIRRLRRTFAFDDFAGALAFTDAVGAAAEAESHHPELTTTWGQTTVMWWTHTIRNLHRNDFVMAAKTDRIYRAAH